MIAFIIFYYIFSVIFYITYAITIETKHIIRGALLAWLLFPIMLGNMIGNFNRINRNI